MDTTHPEFYQLQLKWNIALRHVAPYVSLQASAIENLPFGRHRTGTIRQSYSTSTPCSSTHNYIRNVVAILRVFHTRKRDSRNFVVDSPWLFFLQTHYDVDKRDSRAHVNE